MRKIDDVRLMSIKKRVRSMNAKLELNSYQHLSDLETNVKDLLELIQKGERKK